MVEQCKVTFLIECKFNKSPPSTYGHVIFSSNSAIWKGKNEWNETTILLICSVRSAFVFFPTFSCFLVFFLLFWLFIQCVLVPWLQLFAHLVQKLDLVYEQLTVHRGQQWQGSDKILFGILVVIWLVIRLRLWFFTLFFTVGQLISIACTFLSKVMTANCLYLVQL